MSVIVSENNISSFIYTIRGQQVMLDFDLAMIYGYEVKRLNEQVKNNIARFPEDFMFKMTKSELESLRSIFSTTNFSSKSRALPYCFTEQGIYMLATVLRGETADRQSIFIMRAFREMRHYIQQNRQFVTRDEWKLIMDRQDKADCKILEIRENVERMKEDFMMDIETKNYVIYKGQKFEADVAYIDIYRKAQKSIYVIDDYVNIKTLEQLAQKKTGVSVVLFTENKHSHNGFLTASQVEDFNTEYPTITIKSNSECHDRFIVLDYGTGAERLYSCGHSCKDAGNKVCSINEIENTVLIHPVIEKLMQNPDRVI